MLDLFPETAAVDDEGVLAIGGCLATDLADAHGTPLIVYCEHTIRNAVAAYREAAPDASVVYGTKAFANVALLRLLADEGVGADVSTLGELAYARAAGFRGDRILFHGNNKSDEELRAAAEVGALVVLDAPDEPERSASAGVRQALVRLTPGVEAVTHEAIRTAHDESKFGLSPDAALAAIADARGRGIDVRGVHVHIGSQLVRADESLLTVDRVAAFCERAHAELGWTPAVVDLGGGLGVSQTPAERAPSTRDFVGALVERFRAAWPEPRPHLILEPGRSLVGRAAVTLYRIGVVKRSGGVTYAAVDGGMSDNPRPQLYSARYTALLANRAAEPTVAEYRIAGKHCESGDVLIDSVSLPEPRRGDLLALPATGGYTLAMGSNYNGVPRPAVVLVAEGAARTIRRRETVDELLAHEE
jgi:diaminopimelate decarboxylase